MTNEVYLDNFPNVYKLTRDGNGAHVYIIGTCHVDVTGEISRNIENIIRMVQPDFVVVELCEKRMDFLLQDEQDLIEDLRKGFWWDLIPSFDVSSNIDKMYRIISRKLDLIPGLEFKTAYNAAKLIPGCKIILGDISIDWTVEKLNDSLSFWNKFFPGSCLKSLIVASLSFWNKLQIAFETWILNFVPASYLKSLIVAEMEESIRNDVADPLCDGRDEFLTFSLQRAADQISSDGQSPTVVVGVFGQAHIPGIKKNFNKITEEQIEDILDFTVNGIRMDLNTEVIELKE